MPPLFHLCHKIKNVQMRAQTFKGKFKCPILEWGIKPKKKLNKHFLLFQSVTNEDVTQEELGGAKTHTTVSG